MQFLCEKINMPEEVTEILLRLHNTPGFQPDTSLLLQEESWAEGLAQLRISLGEDPKGFKILCCMLRCAIEARETYVHLGLSDQIYFDTFACFSRFVREHQDSYGCYGFDRSFWTVRQVSCKLFRIGELEYELTALQGQPAVSIHIPSDACLDLSLLSQSCENAKRLLSHVFPEYAQGPVFCRSWLLSPDLRHMLPSGSRILAFQESFDITPLPNSTGGYALWVFKDPRLAPQDYPETTSLQRRLKAWLLEGNIFSDAMGILKEHPFQSNSP